MTASRLVPVDDQHKNIHDLMTDFAFERESVQAEVDDLIRNGKDVSVFQEFEEKLEQTDHIHLVHFPGN